MNIVCAVDESEFSHWALEAVGNLFHQSVNELVLLHVVDLEIWRGGRWTKPKKAEAGTRDIPKKLEAAGKRVLTGCAQRMEVALSQAATKPLTNLKTAMVKGHPADAIIRYAEKHKPDVLVVGTRGLKDLPGYLLGSVSRKILTHGPCSVMTIKERVDVPASLLLALDGSKPSRYAANRVKDWFDPDVTTIHLVTVVPDTLTEVSQSILSKSRLKALKAPLQEQARECLEHYRKLFLQEGFQVSGKQLQGHPREQILESVPSCHAQLVVMGSKGLTGLDRFSMGSVSEWVSAYAPSSVLVIRH